MITPLGQRQIFQTANVEAVRMSLEMSEHIQREAARRKAAEDHLAEDQDSVHEIEKADGLRTEERRGRGGQEAQAGEAEEREDGEEPLPEESESAAPPPGAAEGHLDFLA
ncbi:hypothetical protein [Holophaga foetida]|uniref:hypothetical protein n=1 Tax=Holophaga foetida TaxID=35839 RepID=UPI0002474D0C|nr:hypothetical protein [Holophaga foetida]